MPFASSVSRSITSCLLTSSLLLSSPAFATPPATLAPIEEVRLTDGSLVRGVIVERTAQGDVTFALPSGETRKFAKKDVIYAGPIETTRPSGPSLVPPPPPASADPPVSFAVDAPEMQVHVRQSNMQLLLGSAESSSKALELAAATYRSICIVPCSTTLAPGPHHFALSRGFGSLTEVPIDVETQSGSHVSFHFESNESTRSVGRGLFWGAAGLALVTLASGVLYASVGQNNNAQPGTAAWQASLDETHDHQTTGLAVALVGIGVSAVLATVGLLLQRTKDHAALALPGDLPAAPRDSVPARNAAPAPATDPTHPTPPSPPPDDDTPQTQW